METPPNLPTPTLPKQVSLAWPPAEWRDCHLVVALSGGPDSVALLRALDTLQRSTAGQGRVVAAHFNHAMRPGEADADEAWVRTLCERLDLPIFVGRAPSTSSLTSEQQARDARYHFLQQTAEATGARYVATGHTADDQIETVLMRVLRGSGIAGLSGIPPVRSLSPSVTVVRPLLSIRRREIEAYLTQIDQGYLTDATNADPHFTRNWIRGELLPLVRHRLPSDVDRAMLRLGEQASEWREAIGPIVERVASGAIRVAPDRVDFDTRPLADFPKIFLQEACRHAWRSAGWPEQAMGMAEWQRLAAAVAGEEFAPFMLPSNVRVRREGADVVLAPAEPAMSRDASTCP